MNKQSKLKLLFAAVALFVSITVYSVIFGNPLFEYFARNTANRYIADNYPGCYISEITYNMVGVFGGYRAVIKSDNNLDFEKTAYIDLTGLLINKKAMEFFMNDRIKQLTIGPLTVILTLCILWHTGNPVNWLRARVKASDYLQQNYGKSYSFTCKYMQLSKVKGYKCTIKSTDFPNGVLHICILDNGEIIG